MDKTTPSRKLLHVCCSVGGVREQLAVEAPAFSSDQHFNAWPMSVAYLGDEQGSWGRKIIAKAKLLCATPLKQADLTYHFLGR